MGINFPCLEVVVVLEVVVLKVLEVLQVLEVVVLKVLQVLPPQHRLNHVR